jgi:polyhydroxybutyrate depolymerase
MEDEGNMKNKIIGILVCMLLITTCVIPASITVSASNVKKSSVSPGDYFRFMFFGMRLRSYRIHIPPSYDGSNPVPLVLALHGWPGNSKFMPSLGMNVEADEDGFIVVYPNGESWSLHDALSNLINYGFWPFYWNCWNINNVDDVGFFRTLIEKLQTTLDINSSRIYITGVSGGGFMTYRLGAELSDIVAAIAPVCGSIGGRLNASVPLYINTPKHPLPIIVFHGMNDSNVPYFGAWWVISVKDSVSFWVNCDHCDPTPQINTSEDGNIIRKTYANGSLGTEVVLYTIVDGVHGWPGVDYPCEINATEFIWDFFAAHPKQ